jgi:hypothetical protein
LASAEPQRIRLIDADGPPAEVVDRAWEALSDLV